MSNETPKQKPSVENLLLKLLQHPRISISLLITLIAGGYGLYDVLHLGKQDNQRIQVRKEQLEDFASSIPEFSSIPDLERVIEILSTLGYELGDFSFQFKTQQERDEYDRKLALVYELGKNTHLAPPILPVDGTKNFFPPTMFRQIYEKTLPYSPALADKLSDFFALLLEHDRYFGECCYTVFRDRDREYLRENPPEELKTQSFAWTTLFATDSMESRKDAAIKLDSQVRLAILLAEIHDELDKLPARQRDAVRVEMYEAMQEWLNNVEAFGLSEFEMKQLQLGLDTLFEHFFEKIPKQESSLPNQYLATPALSQATLNTLSTPTRYY